MWHCWPSLVFRCLGVYADNVDMHMSDVCASLYTYMQVVRSCWENVRNGGPFTNWASKQEAICLRMESVARLHR